MGQKVNPIGLRLALNKNWSSLWFARKENFGNWLHEDAVIRNHIVKIMATPRLPKYSSNVTLIAYVPRFIPVIRVCSLVKKVPTWKNCVKK